MTKRTNLANPGMKLRKLKMNQNFQPMSVDVEDEMYPNGFFVFNITKLLKFIKENPDKFHPEECLVSDARTFPSSNLNENTIRLADISEPIILAEIAPNRFNVIDGRHRLENAYRMGKDKILVYRVHPETHCKFLISKAEYEDYIEYWNSKLTELYS